MQNESEEASFEQLMVNLEECVSRLESGGLSLNLATEVYEKGMALAAEAGRRLSETELRVTNIKAKYQEMMERSEEVIKDEHE
ncbi:MAG: exodeoxyribonuclease VII small subunit [SAR202 cluster bacterium Ae2-Chloro-G2]|nr:MAG: exodeoxyribonuclease VII small subunit [SAR202 cluster bacterium Ae2-Chloro-G2]